MQLLDGWTPVHLGLVRYLPALFWQAAAGGNYKPSKYMNLQFDLNNSNTVAENKTGTEEVTMEFIVTNKDLTKEEKYFLTKAQDIQKMTEAVDQTLDLAAWAIYTDKNVDGQEVELFSMLTEDGDKFATNSRTFIGAFREILDIFEPAEVKRLKVMNGTSKNNRTFVTCAYVSPIED